MTPFFDSDDLEHVPELEYRPGDRVLHNEREYEILALYKADGDDVTLVDYSRPGGWLVRARLRDLRHAL